MESSILKSVKKRLNVPESEQAFDEDILMCINTALGTVTQLGVGPLVGFYVEDDAPTWDDLLGDDLRLNMVRDFVSLNCRLAFDPPATSFHIAAIEKQLEQLAWRIEAAANPAPHVEDIDGLRIYLPDPEVVIVFDGGGA